MLGDDDEDLWRMAVNKLYSLQLKGPSYPLLKIIILKDDLLMKVQFRLNAQLFEINELRL